MAEARGFFLWESASRLHPGAPSKLVERALAQKILKLGGTVGETSALFTTAALDAIERGTEPITSASLGRCGYVAPRGRRHPTALAIAEGSEARLALILAIE